MGKDKWVLRMENLLIKWHRESFLGAREYSTIPCVSNWYPVEVVFYCLLISDIHLYIAQHNLTRPSPTLKDMMATEDNIITSCANCGKGEE